MLRYNRVQLIGKICNNIPFVTPRHTSFHFAALLLARHPFDSGLSSSTTRDRTPAAKAKRVIEECAQLLDSRLDDPRKLSARFVRGILAIAATVSLMACDYFPAGKKSGQKFPGVGRATGRRRRQRGRRWPEFQWEENLGGETE